MIGVQRRRSYVRGIPIDVLMDSRLCACGSIVAVVAPFTEERIEAAVVSHRTTTLHKRWADRGGMDLEP